jgi:hypothetical protein
MTQQTLEIIVTSDGRTSVQTLGFQGAACRDASKFLEEALGKPFSDRRTAEFYQTTTASTQAHERQ